jgi:carboxyl-terminal processing protease
MNTAKWTAAGIVLALAVAFGVGVYAGVSERSVLAASDPQNIDFTKFWRAWELLDQNFVQTHASSTIPTNDEKLYGAIAGLTAAYGDPYTVFMPPQEAKQFNEDIAGAFGGVGMELGDRNGALTVVAPLKDTPAERAGMRSGDVIVAIDGTPSRTMAVDEAVKKIRGKVGTTVTLLIERTGAKEPLEVKIVRDTISVPVLKHYKRPDGIYVIELYSFSETSPTLFRQAIRGYFESGSTQLMLDLRGNPGGYLEAAVDMASYFLKVGESVVTEDYQGKRGNVVHRSYGYDVFANKKTALAILVDQGSASASEILAGALQGHNKGKLIGTRTFGKGSVQQLMDLGGGAQLKVTVARWLTPSGVNISAGGLTPDIQADRTIDDVKAGKDPQKDAAVTWLQSQ